MHQFWATFAGCLLLILLVLAADWQLTARARRQTDDKLTEQQEAAMLPILLDQVPTPLVRVQGTRPSALNRAARQLFGTDDQILPAPPELLSPDSPQVRIEGRLWRIDRVQAPGSSLSVVALIDIEAVERVAEARAASDMIETLGHELLNGLAPIVSLAESAEQAMQRPDTRDRLLPEILGTLARRTDGLMRFTTAYRALARLPNPAPAPTDLHQLAEDLARLFHLQWGGRVALSVEVKAEGPALLDRDQLTQAIWALMNNGAEAAISGASPAAVQLAFSANATGLTISVQDSGPGVAPDLRDRIFRPFFTTKEGGSGIGLSLARQIARAQGGELSLQPAMPTTFRLRLPPTPATA
ncbi:sensor histidine kinase [Sandaracinobacter neustonicus]|uniref:histidine kinase n=2 Tax=Sandaracinobacter neustonicus TaxID=1715348 RepID=A0A501XW78_9SPHN|nr:sensor histidine kinase [Sandaracinobacter neustonicus]